MQFYQELTIQPGPEMPANFILSKIYQTIHLAFVSHKDAEDKVTYGVSFPEYSPEGDVIGLGRKIRIFAETEEQLEQLGLSNVLKRYTDYVRIKRIRPVPMHTSGYAIYSRYHTENSQAQKARRYARRHGIDISEAGKLFPKDKKGYQYPYIQLRSASNKHPFRMYVRKETANQPVNVGFSVYGLSNQSSVPEF